MEDLDSKEIMEYFTNLVEEIESELIDDTFFHNNNIFIQTF